MIVQAAREGSDIINLSLGTMTVDGLPPLAFTTALDIVQAGHPGVLVVASAGNTGQESPMFPAAMKGVIGVGALAADLTPGPWSNHGFWVNCPAVGIGIISTFVEGNEPHTQAGAVVTEQFSRDARPAGLRIRRADPARYVSHRVRGRDRARHRRRHRPDRRGPAAPGHLTS
jgi:subtilisin family serine protease